ncbi:hypothetical protein D3C84_665020 [compost metagenome]
MGCAQRDLQFGVDLPQPFYGFQTVPAGRHTHVDEGHGIGLLAIQRGLHLG